MKVLIFIIFINFASTEDSFQEVSSNKKVQKSISEEEDFKNWKKVQSKSYSTKQDEEDAADNYVMTKRKVEAFNKRTNESYKQDVQNYADQNPNDLLKKKAGLKIPENFKTTPKYTTLKPKHVGSVTRRTTKKNIKNSVGKIPDQVNYTKSFLNAKDQLNCASCYVIF
jgi:hypothetical protein